MRKKPVQQRSRQMVETIVDATARVIGQEGMGALTMNRVAEVAGISNGSLYQYFHDREDLLEALLERTSRDLMALFDQHLPQVEQPGVDPGTGLRVALKLVLEYMRANPTYIELIRHWGQLPLPVFLEPMERYWLGHAQRYLFTHAPGAFRPDLQARFYMLFNNCFFNLLRYASEPASYIREEDLLGVLADNVVATLLPASSPAGSAP